MWRERLSSKKQPLHDVSISSISAAMLRVETYRNEAVIDGFLRNMDRLIHRLPNEEVSEFLQTQ
jgi:hypothetical protein